MSKLLTLLLLLTGISTPSVTYGFTVHSGATTFQDQNVVAAAIPTNTATLVSVYVVAKGRTNTMVTGGTLQFFAYGTYSDGSVVELPESETNPVIAWNTSNHAIAKISRLGHATAIGAGSVDIEAAVGDITASPWTVTVTASTVPHSPSISCSANPSIITPGGTSVITAAGSSPQNLPLTYSYSASAGSISGTGTSETLQTPTGFGGLVTVTCTVDQQGGGSASATTSVLVDTSLSVDAGNNLHAISPDIYGIAYGPGLTPPDVTFATQIQLPNIRWGGDAATNYNWQTDTTNAGNDYYFINFRDYTTPSPTPGYMPDQMIATYRTAYSGVHPLITVPIIPWIADNSTLLCSYPVSMYGAQQSTTDFTGQSCGNGVSVSGSPLLDSSPSVNYVPNSIATQEAWINHLISRFGTASSGGVTYYQLDNEPSAWHGTHRDLEPVQPDYSTIVSLGTQYASMIKTEDSSAKVLGPSDFTEYGWIWYIPADTSLYAGQYYLQQMAAYATAHGNTRVLDYFDEHWACPDMSSATAELNSTRTLWDATYNTGSPFEIHIGGPVMMIPRFRAWIDTYYPGTQISISEYECVANPASPSITDALAETDILGIFGAQGVALANNVNRPKPNDPLAFSYLMYRNYDGEGSKFGDISVTSTSTAPAALSVYGALRSSDGKLTVMVINKTSTAINAGLSLVNCTAASRAAVYTYGSADLTQIVAGSPVVVSSHTVEYDFPAYSATLFILSCAESAGS